MSISKKMAGTLERRLCALWLSVVLGLLFLAPTITRAQQTKNESGLALREISQFQWYPPDLDAAGLVDGKTGHTLQGLARFWAKWTGKTLRTQFELECSGWSSSQRQRRMASSGWQSKAGDETFKRWMWTTTPRDNDRFTLTSSIERLSVSGSLGRLDFDLGRQPISLGTSHFIGILDVIAPFHPGYLDGSYKPGVDALRIRTGWGTSGEAELISVAARDPSQNAFIGRLRRTFSGIDVEILGGRLRDRNMTGLAWEGEKRGITWWGEAAAFQRLRDRERFWGGDEHFALSWVCGLEKELKPKLKGGIAFLYQDFGGRTAGDLSLTALDAPFQEGWTFLSASRYGNVTLRREITPLVNAEMNLIVNLVDGSSLLQPKVIFSTGNNSDIAAFAWLSSGKSPTAGPPPNVRSEFGTFPDGIGFIIRRFF